MLRKPSCSSDDDDVTGLKEFVHWVLAEPNTKHPRIAVENIGYFIDQWYHP